MCSAARDHQAQRLIEVIDEGRVSVDASPKKAKGWTPLHYACKKKNSDLALLLIGSGAYLYQRNTAGEKRCCVNRHREPPKEAWRSIR